MPNNNPFKFYAVAKGRCPGIYRSWGECRKQTDGYSGAIFKSFVTLGQAEAFLSSQAATATRLSEFRLSESNRKRKITEGPFQQYLDSSFITDNTSITIKKEKIHSEILTNNKSSSYSQRKSTSEPIKHSHSVSFRTDHGATITTTAIDSEKHSNTKSSQVTKSDSMTKQGISNRNDTINIPTTATCTATLYFDGGSRGNPGIAGAGAYIRVIHTKPNLDNSTKNPYPTTDITIHKIRWYCGSHVTNNVAEYNGLLQGLDILYPILLQLKEDVGSSHSLHFSILVYGDSKLVIEQIKGSMMVRNPTLQILHTSCMDRIRTIQSHCNVYIQFQHVYREQNHIADGTCV